MKKILQATYRCLHDLTARLFGFEVVAVWDGAIYAHWALNEKEACEWVQAYRGVSASVRVWSGDRQLGEWK